MPPSKLSVVFLAKDKPVCHEALDFLLSQKVDLKALVVPETFPSYTGIPRLTPQEVVKIERPDYVLSFLYWQKIKDSLLSWGRRGCLNFHPAPLPAYRGVAGYSFAILNQETAWGVSAHFVDQEFDTGDVISVKHFPIIAEKETAASLEKRTRPYLLALFQETIRKLLLGQSLKAKKQNGGRYYTHQMLEEARTVKSDDPPETVERKIRAFWSPPYPGAKITLQGQEYTLVSQEILRTLKS